MFVSRSYKTLVLQIRNNYAYVIQNPSSFRFISRISEPNIVLPSDSTNAVDFLMNSCGLPLEKATSVAKKIHPTFKTENSISVLSFLKTTGFSETHITKLISMYPTVLFSSVEKTLKPKLELFQEIGFSDAQIADMMVLKPSVFFRSLRCQILPSLESIRSFVQKDKNVVRVIKRSKFMLTNNLSTRLEPNISILRECNIPDSRIAYVMMTQPGILLLKAEVLKETIEKLKKLGFKPESKMFTVAMHAMCSMSKSTWDSKVKLLKERGWSDEQIIDSFKRMPQFMTCSKAKMKVGLDFFSKTLKWDASVLSKYPKCLLFSLKSRVVPRVKVFKILMSKKVLSTEKELIKMLDMSEEDFFWKFVVKYKSLLPDLSKSQEGELKWDEWRTALASHNV